VPARLDAFSGAGSGTPGDPYVVTSAEQLQEMRDDRMAHYILGCDIDAAATAAWNGGGGFEPVGAGGWDASFGGTLDGKGHTIDRLYIDRQDGGEIALFARTDSAVISNLRLRRVVVRGRGSWAESAGLVAYCWETTISNCSVSGSISSSGSAGGLVGNAFYSVLRSCYSSGSVAGNNDVGGLVDHSNLSEVIDSFSACSVMGNHSVAGLVGEAWDTPIARCFATGRILGRDSTVGGLIGHGSHNNEVVDSYWDAEVTGQTTSGESDPSFGKTTAEMLQRTTFGGWDFGSTWTNIEGVTYPWLQSLPPPSSPIMLNASVSGSGTAEFRTFDGAVMTNVTASTSPVVVSIFPWQPVVLVGTGDSGQAFAQWAGDGFDADHGLAANPASCAWGESPTIVSQFLPGAIEIASIEALQQIGRGLDRPLHWHYRLTQDLDASGTAGWDGGAGFKPIGTATYPFGGTFDGGNHVISSLWIDRPTEDFVGLFADASGAAIHGLGLRDAAIQGNDWVGCLAGACLGSAISNCFATGLVVGKQYVGGLFGGFSISSLAQSHAISLVSGTDDVGGLAGRGYGATIDGCYAAGDVRCFSGGGLLGLAASPSTVTNSYWDIDATGQTSSADSDPSSGRTTGAMVQQATYAGWDFATAWTMIDGVTYPSMQGFAPVAAPVTLTLSASGAGTAMVRKPDGTPLGGVTAATSPATVFLMPWQPVVFDGVEGGGETLALWSGDGFDPEHGLTRDPCTIAWTRSPNVVGEFLPATVEIDSVEELQQIGHDPGYPLHWHYRLAGDVDAGSTATWNAGAGFDPIGTTKHPFTGVFDGQGFGVGDLRINRPSESDTGLFGVLRGGTVRLLRVENASVVGLDEAGIVAGTCRDSTLLRISTSGSISGDYQCGGIIGVAKTNTVIDRCESGAAVVANSGAAGGVAGNIGYSQMKFCSATGDVSGDTWIAGGLVGELVDSDLESCFAMGNVRGLNGTAGGLVGDGWWYYTQPAIRNSYACGSVSGDYLAGGLCGYFDGIIDSCYAAGPVSEASYSGGLVGNFHGVISNSYWDVETTGKIGSAGGSGKTTAEMMQQGTFEGWDFAGTWGIRESVTYPYLRYSPPDSDQDSLLDPWEYDAFGSLAQVALGDWDRDGKNHLLEHGLALNSTEPSGGADIVATFASGGAESRLVCSFSVRADNPRLRYFVELSDDLVHWAGVPLLFDGSNWSLGGTAVAVTGADDRGDGTWGLEFATSGVSPSRRFMRVRIEAR